MTKKNAKPKKYFLFVCKGCKSGECHVIFYTPREKETRFHRLENCHHPARKWVPVGGNEL
jgi:hypothetical protein